MDKIQTLVSGTTPSGNLHIGNYLGALQNWVEFQNSGKYHCIFMVADLHSMTDKFDFANEHKKIQDHYLTYLACGLDPKKSIIYLQSQVPANAEFSWILSNITPFGELRRMTQFKDKSNDKEESTNIGLFTYPILMASDILLYNAEVVPVGEDQLQHLELTRTLARKYNHQFNGNMLEPKGVLTKTPRVMSLDDPTRKMSKSRPEGCLFLDDTPKDIEKKIKTAVTDSESLVRYDEENKPGISNLMLIYSSFSGKSLEEIETEFSGKNYGAFKTALVEEVTKALSPIREKKEALKKKLETEEGYIELSALLEDGNARARAIANANIAKIKKELGLWF